MIDAAPTKPTKPPKAILYLRFSPRPDAATSEANEVQEHYCREYCEKQGYVVGEVHKDPDHSGDDEDRPGLWDAVNATRRGCILIVHKSDRLARSVYLDEYIRRAVKKQGGRIEVVEGCPNGDSAEEVLMRQTIAAFAEYFKKAGNARTKAAMLRHMKAGRAMGGKAPYGLKEGPLRIIVGVDGSQIKRRSWIVSEEERAVIDLIRVAKGSGSSLSQVALMLDKAEIPRRTRTKWDAKAIWRICRREGIATS